MAITIQQTPLDFTTIGNPIVFTLTSSNFSQPNFKFVCDVFVNGSMVGRLKSIPNPSNLRGVFNVRELVRNYIGITAIQNATSSVTIDNMSIDLLVEFREEYSGTLHTTHVDSSCIVYMGAIDTLDFPTFTDYQKYVFNGGLIVDKYLLTNRPFPAKMVMYDDGTGTNTYFQDGFIYIPCNKQSTPNIDSIIYEYVMVDGTIDRKFAMKTNNFIQHDAGDDNLTNVIAVPFSPLAIFNIDEMMTSDGISGAGTFGCHFWELKQINVYFGKNYDTTISSIDTYPLFNQLGYVTIEFVNPCKMVEFTEIHFQNQLGGVDSYVFTKPNRESIEVTKTIGSKPLNDWMDSSLYGYDVESHQRFVSNVDWKKRFVVVSDYLTDDEFEWLWQMVTSPNVWVIRDGKMVPIIITTNSYQKFKRQYDQLNKLTIEYQFTIDETIPQ